MRIPFPPPSQSRYHESNRPYGWRLIQWQVLPCPAAIQVQVRYRCGIPGQLEFS
jgi:hypothetical protein